MASKDDTNFLGHGRVDSIGHDSETRKALVDITIPYVLLIGVNAPLLRYGSIKKTSISDPLAVWQPEIQEMEIKPQVASLHPNIKEDAWKLLQEKLGDLMRSFFEVSEILRDVHDIANVLPMGTYVTIRYSFEIDKSMSILQDLQSLESVRGCPEFQFAFAASIARTLNDIEPTVQ